MKVGELVVDFVIGGDGSETLKELIDAMGELNLVSISEVAILQRFSKAMIHTAEDIMETSLSLNHFKNVTGLSIETLQRWINVGAHVGLTTDQVTSSVTALQLQLKEMALFGGSSAFFNQLGIPIPKNAYEFLDIMARLAQSGKLTKDTLSVLIQKFPALSTMIDTLYMSKHEREEIGGKGHFFTDADIENGKALHGELQDLHIEYTKFKQELLLPMLPAIVQGFKEINGFIKESGGHLNALARVLNAIAPYLAIAAGVAALPAGVPVGGAVAASAGFLALWNGYLKEKTQELFAGGGPDLGHGEVLNQPALAPAGGGHTIQQTNTIHVHGAKDPQAAGEHVESALSKMLKQAAQTILNTGT